MGKMLKFILIVLGIIIMIALALVSTGVVLYDFYRFFILIGGGDWVKGLIFSPFAIIGGIQVVRGACKVWGDDTAQMLNIKTGIFYSLLMIVSYFILIMVIINLFTN